MTELAPDWEIVARKTRGPIAHLLFVVLQMLLFAPVPPQGYSSVTFTVRNRTTGETRKVTAKSEEEAALLIAQGRFDGA
jgi:hypothetical protein